MDKRFTQLIEDATTGLKDDPELRLDVSHELASHLEETARQFTGEGMGEEESAEQAVKAFGSPLEVAGELLAANKGRMKLRALARLAMRAVLVPAAVLVALYIGYGGLVRLADIASVINQLTEDERVVFLPHLPFTSSLEERLYQEDSASAKFDMWDRRQAKPEFQVWQKDPSNKINCWDYVNALLSRGYQPRDNAELVKVIRNAEKVEPENAYYNYVLAALLLRDAVEEAPYMRPEKLTMYKDIAVTVKDRTLLDQAMAELRRGVAKPYLRTYHQEMQREQLAKLPRSQRTEDYIIKLNRSVSMLNPELAIYRTLARVAPFYAQLRSKEGHHEEAQVYLQAWRKLSIDITKDSHSLIDVLVADMVAMDAGTRTALVYEHLGKQEDARQTLEEMQRLTAPVEVRKERRKHSGSSNDQVMIKHGNVLASILEPVFADDLITADSLAPLRNLDYILFEQATMNLFILLLTLCMLVAVLSQFGLWLKLRKQGLRPLLILPPWQTLVRIGIFGILLPLLVYYVYTRWSGLAGREYGLRYRLPWFLVEVAALGLVLLIAPVTLARRALAKRCRMLGIPSPKRSPGRIILMLLAIIAAIGSSTAALLIVTNLSNPSLSRIQDAWAHLLISITASGITASAAFIMTVLFVRWVYRLARPSGQIANAAGYGCYYATLARSLVPVYALAIILLAAIGSSYLSWSETHWLHKDRLVLLQDGEVGLTPMETQVTNMLTQEMLQATGEGNKK